MHLDVAFYQKILFRQNPDESVKDLAPDTITYGTTCASFLAIRALYQMSKDKGAQHPITAAMLKKDFYVNDLLTGANTR